MVNKEAAALLVKYALEIQKRAVIGDVAEGKTTLVTKRAHEAAWRMTSELIHLLEHAKESDMYDLLLGMAIRDDKSKREQYRLSQIVKQEDRGFIQYKLKLEQSLREIVKRERTDPDCAKQAKADAKRDSERAVRAAENAAFRLENRRLAALARKEAKAATAKASAGAAAQAAKPITPKKRKTVAA